MAVTLKLARVQIQSGVTHAHVTVAMCWALTKGLVRVGTPLY